MQTKQDIETVITQLGVGISSLFPQDHIEAILFGSYARGDADSDIDVLVPGGCLPAGDFGA